MRAYQIIAVVAVILVGVGAKLVPFADPTAEADSLAFRSAGLDVSQLHHNKNLPAQKSHDMSVVFPGAQAASDTQRTGWFTPACASRDLRAFATIEGRGEAADAPTERLADAGLKYLQARMLCLSGQEDEGVALYDSIIDFEAPVLNATNTTERVKP
jgi:hypothetical protein